MRTILISAMLAMAAMAWPGGNGEAAPIADGVKQGRWEFNAQLQMPAAPQRPTGAPAAAPGVGASHTMCVEPDKAVPTDPRPECKIERMTRNGGVINWASACASPRGVVRSEGIAHYRGDTMEASLTTHIPQADGKAMETHQRITGRYLGPCGK